MFVETNAQTWIRGLLRAKSAASHGNGVPTVHLQFGVLFLFCLSSPINPPINKYGLSSHDYIPEFNWRRWLKRDATAGRSRIASDEGDLAFYGKQCPELHGRISFVFMVTST